MAKYTVATLLKWLHVVLGAMTGTTAYHEKEPWASTTTAFLAFSSSPTMVLALALQ